MEVFAGCIVIFYRPRDEPSDRRRPPGAAQGRRVQAPAHALARRGGATTYQSLRRRVWGDRGGANPETVRNAIRKLRRKIGDDARNPRHILNDAASTTARPGGKTPEAASGRDHRRIPASDPPPGGASRRQVFEFRGFSRARQPSPPGPWLPGRRSFRLHGEPEYPCCPSDGANRQILRVCGGLNET